MQKWQNIEKLMKLTRDEFEESKPSRQKKLLKAMSDVAQDALEDAKLERAKAIVDENINSFKMPDLEIPNFGPIRNADDIARFEQLIVQDEQSVLAYADAASALVSIVSSVAKAYIAV